MCIDAAKGPCDYHGTINMEELEREAGGNDYQGSRNGNGKNRSSGSYYPGWMKMPDGSWRREQSSRSSFSSSNSVDSSSAGRQNLFGSSYSSSSSSSEGSSPLLPKGQWVWNQSADNGKGKWEWSTTTFQESHFSVTKASETQGSGRSSGGESYTSFASGKDSTGNYHLQRSLWLHFCLIIIRNLMFFETSIFSFHPQIMSYGTAKHVKLIMVLPTANGQINLMPTEGVYPM